MPSERAPRRRSVTNATTISDVARVAGVSPQTVSRVLRQAADVSDEAKQRVEDAVRAVGYVPNMAARNLASNRSMLVAAIIPLLASSIFGETMQGAQEVLDEAGYQTFIGYTNYDPAREEKLVRSFLGRRPDGFLIVGTNHTPATVDLLRQSGLPVVETWDWTGDPIDQLVGFSNRDAIAALTRAIADKGLKRPVFAGVVDSGDYRAVARRDGFVATARELWPGEPPRVVSLERQPLTMEVGAETFRQILADYPDVDVVLFTSDIFAAGAILAAPDLNVRIPEDVAVAGFGDYEIATRLHPTLTTVSVPAHRLGRVSAEVLLERMQKRGTGRESRDLGYTIVMRESC